MHTYVYMYIYIYISHCPRLLANAPMTAPTAHASAQANVRTRPYLCPRLRPCMHARACTRARACVQRRPFRTRVVSGALRSIQVATELWGGYG